MYFNLKNFFKIRVHLRLFAEKHIQVNSHD